MATTDSFRKLVNDMLFFQDGVDKLMTCALVSQREIVSLLLKFPAVSTVYSRDSLEDAIESRSERKFKDGAGWDYYVSLESRTLNVLDSNLDKEALDYLEERANYYVRNRHMQGVLFESAEKLRWDTEPLRHSVVGGYYIVGDCEDDIVIRKWDHAPGAISYIMDLVADNCMNSGVHYIVIDTETGSPVAHSFDIAEYVFREDSAFNMYHSRTYGHTHTSHLGWEVMETSGDYTLLHSHWASCRFIHLHDHPNVLYKAMKGDEIIRLGTEYIGL